MDDYKKMKVQVREAKHHSTRRSTLQNATQRERERAHLSLSLSLILSRAPPLVLNVTLTTFSFPFFLYRNCATL
jgi:hypothetical protein